MWKYIHNPDPYSTDGQETSAFVSLRRISDTAQHTHGGNRQMVEKNGKGGGGQIKHSMFSLERQICIQIKISNQQSETRHKDQRPETRDQLKDVLIEIFTNIILNCNEFLGICN